MSAIAQNLIKIKNSIAHFEAKYGRKKGSVHLLAISKGHSAEKIFAAYQTGQSAFGENYLQEALTKMKVYAHLPIEWHFIGNIQSNKTRKIAEHFSWVQSIADSKIAERLNEHRPSHLPPLNICLEVNISKARQKSGVLPEEVLPLAKFCHQLPRLKLRGLMAIPEPQPDFLAQRQEFRKLSKIYQALNRTGFMLDTLSLGMSDDFEAAIAEGATMVRIGTAIFGQRAIVAS